MRAGESGICPHCRTGVRFEDAKTTVGQTLVSFGIGQVVRLPSNSWIQIVVSGCPVCHQVIVSAPLFGPPEGGQHGGPGRLYPKGATRPLPPEVSAAVPSVAADFAEAVAVLPASRKASAALSRRCLQAILSSAGGAKKRDLADQIDEVLPKLPAQLAENVDAIRHVGNFAAHPLKSTNTGAIVDVEDSEAEWLLDVLEELCDFYYVAPKRALARREALNKKLADLGKSPLKQP